MAIKVNECVCIEQKSVPVNKGMRFVIKEKMIVPVSRKLQKCDGADDSSYQYVLMFVCIGGQMTVSANFYDV